MNIEQKSISRQGWRRVTESQFVSRTFAGTDLHGEDFTAEIGLIYIKKVTAPLVRTMFGEQFILADDGFFWMQIIPQKKSWCLCVMFDRSKRIVQYYFDITRRNVLSGEQSFFEDMFLDVVVLPDGRSLLLDEDELNAALEKKLITRSEYFDAQSTAKMLMHGIPVGFSRLEAFCIKAFSELYKML